MSDIALHTGARLLTTWQPHFRVFLRKLLTISALTTVLLGSPISSYMDLAATVSPLVALLFWGGAFLLSMAFYAFVFDDFTEWRVRRSDRWWLTNFRLIYGNEAEYDLGSEIELTEIRRVRAPLGWSIRLKLDSGLAVNLPLLPERKTIRRTLRSAVEMAKRGTDAAR